MQVCRPDQFICLPDTQFDSSMDFPTSRLVLKPGDCPVAASRKILGGIDTWSAEDSKPCLSIKDPASSGHPLEEMDKADPTFDGTFSVGNVNRLPLKSLLRATSGNEVDDYSSSGLSKDVPVTSPNGRTMRFQHPTLPASSALVLELSPLAGSGFRTMLKSRISRPSTMER
jgi:hypothetical protein